ncbi:MAG: carbon-nitrogen hydrolase [Bernardetiaceae bacterium]
MRIGLIQSRCTQDLQSNFDTACQSIAAVAEAGAQVVVLQELFRSLYFCDTEDPQKFDLAEAIPGPSTAALSEVARQYEVVIVASLFERRAAGLYHNTIAVLDADGSYLGKYRKMHIPDDPGYYEKFYFTPGDLGYKVFPTRYGRIGTLICWDQWFPEAARLTALQGADVLVYPTAIGWADDEPETLYPDQYAAWQTIQRGHAIANGIPVVAVNRVGQEAGMRFWGGSFVADAFGKIIYQAPHEEETTACIPLDLRATEETRRIWPFLRDRRIETYGDLQKRFLEQDHAPPRY